jgi:putative Mg2+ transporter-C (MgtC) family protein
MSSPYLIELAFLLRLALAAVCGVAIGYERQYRMKEAGVRTHFIVALGSALIMLVSKYGFKDQMEWHNLSLDPSRVAAQVVTGIGFLGAGIIFLQKDSIKGLTTAAGVWATAGVGLAIGSGLYMLGLSATVIIIIGQILLHGRIRWLSPPKTELLTLQIVNEPGVIQNIQKVLEEQNITVLNVKSKTNDQSVPVIELQLAVKVACNYNTANLIGILQSDPAVKSVEW